MKNPIAALRRLLSRSPKQNPTPPTEAIALTAMPMDDGHAESKYQDDLARLRVAFSKLRIGRADGTKTNDDVCEFVEKINTFAHSLHPELNKQEFSKFRLEVTNYLLTLSRTHTTEAKDIKTPRDSAPTHANDLSPTPPSSPVRVHA